MSSKWLTEDRDLQIARTIMQHYADKRDVEQVGMLEVVVNNKQKKMNFRLCDWVVVMARHFNTIYGASHGDFVTRKVLSRYMIQGEQIH